MLTNSPTAQAAHRSGSFVDVAGSSHCIEIGDQLLLLDGQPVIIQKVGRDQLCFKQASGVVTCSTEALCYALFGEVPLSPGDIGLLLGQNMARWLTEMRTIRALQRLQTELQSILEERELSALLLPEMGLAPFVQELLATYDGSVDSERAVTYILLKQTQYTHERIHELLAQAGEKMRVLARSATITTAEDGEQSDARETDPTQFTPASAEGAAGENRATAANELKQKEAPGSQGMPGLPDWSTQEEPASGPFQWTEATEGELRQAFSALTEGTTASIAQTIAEEHGWPIGSVKSKLYELRLPQQRRQEKQHEASSSEPSPVSDFPVTNLPDSPMVLERGPLLWDVTIDGVPSPRWRLVYSYGTFPLSREGTPFVYLGCTYVLEHTYHNQLKVSRQLATTSQVEDQAVPVLS